ncbi:Hypothetical predicted protein [Scomber scombrus]|uniref:Uncharacterized protein n=1 Tax=Scomber scombrus TaxID=13677 RepID=A0AAV1QAD1_SCOSC
MAFIRYYINESKCASLENTGVDREQLQPSIAAAFLRALCYLPNELYGSRQVPTPPVCSTTFRFLPGTTEEPKLRATRGGEGEREETKSVRVCRCVTAECVRTSPPPPLSG